MMVGAGTPQFLAGSSCPVPLCMSAWEYTAPTDQYDLETRAPDAHGLVPCEMWDYGGLACSTSVAARRILHNRACMDTEPGLSLACCPRARSTIIAISLAMEGAC